jgi:hypothetical protein
MGDQPEAETQEHEAAPVANASGQKRARTQIEFPYVDLSRSVGLCEKLHGIAGQASVDQTQLAVAMDQSTGGGAFRGRLSAARMFGLIRTDGGNVQLLPLGLQAIDEPSKSAALAEAFLNVPLYGAMFDRYNGFALPPAAAIERQIIDLGVPPKQTERARQAFASSAVTANFIAPNGRFSKPAVSPVPVKETGGAASERTGGGGGGEGHVPPPPQPPTITEKALEYRLVDLMTEAASDPEVMAAIITVITFLKIKESNTTNKATSE